MGRQGRPVLGDYRPHHPNNRRRRPCYFDPLLCPNLKKLCGWAQGKPPTDLPKLPRDTRDLLANVRNVLMSAELPPERRVKKDETFAEYAKRTLDGDLIVVDRARRNERRMGIVTMVSLAKAFGDLIEAGADLSDKYDELEQEKNYKNLAATPSRKSTTDAHAGLLAPIRRPIRATMRHRTPQNWPRLS